jgi:hypothetical protein
MRKYTLTVPLLALFILTGCNENSKDAYLLKNEVDEDYFLKYTKERDEFYKDNCEKEFNKSKDKTFANIKNRIARSNCEFAHNSFETERKRQEANEMLEASIKAAREDMEKSEKEQEEILKKFN